MLRPILIALLLVSPLAAQKSDYTRTEDVIYGRKHGMALTLDVFAPKENSRHAAVVLVVSGGWVSAREGINYGYIAPFIKRGYTVFAVVHGSQPKFTIPECVADMNRAVRFIRHSAKKYDIDPNLIGVTGGSAGGHLSLMLGTAGTAGNPSAKDPVDRESSRVQAVACFFPPTDFLNYGKEGEIALGRGVLRDFRQPFDFKEIDKVTKEAVTITDENKLKEIGRQISPVYHATSDDPPTLIIHGDKDKLVPIQQAQLMVDKLKAVGVTAELITKEGAAHGWLGGIDKDLNSFADWFEKYLVLP